MPKSSTVKLRCVHKYLIATSTKEPSRSMYNYAFFVYCFLMDETEKKVFVLDEEWFCRIQSESSAHLELPLHQQVLVTDDTTDIERGIERLVAVCGKYDNILDDDATVSLVVSIIIPAECSNSLHTDATMVDQERSLKYEINFAQMRRKDWASASEFKLIIVNNYMLILQQRSFYMLNPRNFETCHLSSLPENSYCYLLSSHASQAYAVIGTNRILSVLKYDFHDDKWIEVIDLPMNLLYADVCVCQDMIYVTSYTNKSDGSLASFLSIDPVARNITTLPDLPNSNHDWASSRIDVVDEQLYYDTLDDDDEEEQYTFNFSTKQWELVPFEQRVLEFDDGTVSIGDHIFYVKSFMSENIGLCLLEKNHMKNPLQLCHMNYSCNLKLYKLTFPDFQETYPNSKATCSVMQELDIEL